MRRSGSALACADRPRLVSTRQGGPRDARRGSAAGPQRPAENVVDRSGLAAVQYAHHAQAEDALDRYVNHVLHRDAAGQARSRAGPAHREKARDRRLGAGGAGAFEEAPRGPCRRGEPRGGPGGGACEAGVYEAKAGAARGGGGQVSMRGPERPRLQAVRVVPPAKSPQDHLREAFRAASKVARPAPDKASAAPDEETGGRSRSRSRGPPLQGPGQGDETSPGMAGRVECV